MNPQLLPAQLRDDVPAWAQTVVAFLAEKERRSGSRRTVEGYARMLWPFFDRVGSPDRVTPAHVLAWAHGIGASGWEPSSATVGARIACLSSYFRFLIRMNITTGNPCDALERPRTVQAVARGLSADEVRRVHRLRQDEERLKAGQGWGNVSDLIFTNAEGEPLHPNTIRWVLAQAIATAGVPTFPFHILRRFAATVVGGSGDMAAAQALLGHRAETLTADVYVSKTDAAMDRAAEVMEAAMGR